MKDHWQIGLPGWFVIAAMFAVAIVLWPSAPEKIPMHWNLAGEIDGYSGKFEGLFLMPTIGAFIWGLMNFVPWVRPEKFNDGLRTPFFLFAYAVMLLYVGVFVVQALYSQGRAVNMNYVIWPLVVLLWVCIGNLVLNVARQKARRSGKPQLGTQT